MVNKTNNNQIYQTLNEPNCIQLQLYTRVELKKKASTHNKAAVIYPQKPTQN